MRAWISGGMLVREGGGEGCEGQEETGIEVRSAKMYSREGGWWIIIVMVNGICSTGLGGPLGELREV